MPLLISRICRCSGDGVLVLHDRRDPRRRRARCGRSRAGRRRRPSAPSRPRRARRAVAPAPAASPAAAAARRPTAGPPCPSRPQAPFGLQQRMARAELRLLDGKLRDPAVPPARACTASACDRRRRRRRRARALGGAQHVLDERQAAAGVQHLGQRGLHPGALAGRKDDDVERVHRLFRARPRPGPAGASMQIAELVGLYAHGSRSGS